MKFKTNVKFMSLLLMTIYAQAPKAGDTVANASRNSSRSSSAKRSSSGSRFTSNRRLQGRALPAVSSSISNTLVQEENQAQPALSQDSVTPNPYNISDANNQIVSEINKIFDDTSFVDIDKFVRLSAIADKYPEQFILGMRNVLFTPNLSMNKHQEIMKTYKDVLSRSALHIALRMTNSAALSSLLVILIDMDLNTEIKYIGNMLKISERVNQSGAPTLSTVMDYINNVDPIFKDAQIAKDRVLSLLTDEGR